MAEHVLQPTHAKALVEYVGFLRRKREGCVAEVAAEFKELREMRLFEDNYTKDDVESLLSGLLAVVRTTLKKDLQATMHSSVLILKQQFEQGEKAGVPLEIDLPATENRCHAARRAPDTRRSSPQICKAVGMSKSQLTAWLSSRRAGALAARGERLHRLS